MDYPTQHSFREWLLGMEPEHHCGWPRRAQHCPLANHWRALGAENPVVSAAGWRPRLDVTTCPPVWAAQFVRRVDTLDPREPVTAACALALLE